MSAVMVKPLPKPTRPPITKHYCECGRYLGESTARDGSFKVKCPSCGTWHTLDFAKCAKISAN